MLKHTIEHTVLIKFCRYQFLKQVHCNGLVTSVEIILINSHCKKHNRLILCILKYSWSDGDSLFMHKGTNAYILLNAIWPPP